MAESEKEIMVRDIIIRYGGMKFLTAIFILIILTVGEQDILDGIVKILINVANLIK